MLAETGMFHVYVLNENTQFMPMSKRDPNPNNVLRSDGVFISLMSHTFIIVILE